MKMLLNLYIQAHMNICTCTHEYLHTCEHTYTCVNNPYTWEKRIRWLKLRVYFWPLFNLSDLHVCFLCQDHVLQYNLKPGCSLCSRLLADLGIFGTSMGSFRLLFLFLWRHNWIFNGDHIESVDYFDNQVIYIVIYGCTYMGAFLSFIFSLHFFGVLGLFCWGGYGVLNSGPCMC